MTKEDWLQWKGSEVTAQLFDAIKERVKEAQEMLSESAGLDPLNDRMLCGIVHAFREVAEWTPNLEVEDD